MISYFVPEQYAKNVRALLESAHDSGWSDAAIGWVLVGSRASNRVQVSRWRRGVVAFMGTADRPGPERIAEWLGIPVEDVLYKDLTDMVIPPCAAAPRGRVRILGKRKPKPVVEVQAGPAPGVKVPGSPGAPGEHGAVWVQIPRS